MSLSIISHAQLIINEIQSSNASTHANEFGDYDDWIEIRNLGAIDINLAGLIFLCDDEEETEGVLHTNFKLSAVNGEYLGLLQP